MNIGLIDVENTSFPNLALMKLSALHKQKGDSVEFATMYGNYDILYKSKIFTFTQDNEYCYNAKQIVKGGSGYDLATKIDYDNVCPDYSLYSCEHAYGFLTRGCIRDCDFCIVRQKEGHIKANADIEDFLADKSSAILLDNNVLAIEHGIKQIEKIGWMGIRVDFNQGLDARLIDDSIAKLLSKIKWLSPIRLACDSIGMIKYVGKAVELLRWRNCTPKRYGVYVLVKQDISEAMEIVKFLKGIGCDPFAQAYKDIENKIKMTQEQKNFCRWVNHKAIFNAVSWEDYRK